MATASKTSYTSQLTGDQRRIVLTLWATYGLFYLGRYNLSVAIPDLAEALHVTRADAGILGTVFLWTYAAGQIVSGQLGNFINPRRMVAMGLLLIGIANIAFGFQHSLVAMALIWSVNGVAQSMGWGPVLRMLAAHLNPEQRTRISTLFPMNIPVGTAVTWALVGLMITAGGWRLAFLGGGVCILLLMGLWWISGIDVPPADHLEKPSSFSRADSMKEIFELAPAFILSGFVGFVNLSAVIWLPTYVRDTGVFPKALVGAAAAILPLMGVFGMLFSAYLIRRLGRVMLSLAIISVLTGIPFLLSVTSIVELQLFFVMVAMMVTGGAVGVILSAVPITLAGEGRASSAAGVATAVFSLAGGLGSYVVGAIVESYSWSYVFGLWAILNLLAAVIAWVYRHREKRQA